MGTVYSNYLGDNGFRNNLINNSGVQENKTCTCWNKKIKRSVMFKSMVLLIIMILLSCQSKGQDAVFYLKDKNYFSELNYKAINKINEYPLQELLDSVFNIVNGNFTIYRFERVLNTNSKDNINTPPSKEIIIMKVYKNKIIEAYYCPLHWREPPISDVLLVSNEKIKLSKRIDLKKMKFKNKNPKSEINILKDGVIFISETNN